MASVVATDREVAVKWWCGKINDFLHKCGDYWGVVPHRWLIGDREPSGVGGVGLMAFSFDICGSGRL